MRETIEMSVMPCGCVTRRDLVDGARHLVFIPCRVKCETYQYALRLAAERNLSVVEREAP